MSRPVRLIAYCSVCDKVPDGAYAAPGLILIPCTTCDLLAAVHVVPVKEEP